MLFIRLQYLNRKTISTGDGKGPPTLCRLFDEPDTKFVYGAMTEAYPRKIYYFECWVLIRRLVIAIVAVLAYPEDLPSKFTYLCMLNVIFLAVHFAVRPYTLVTDNYAESLSLLTLTILTLFLIDAPQPVPASLAGGLSAMSFVVAAFFFGRIIYSRYERYKQESALAVAAAGKKTSSAVANGNGNGNGTNGNGSGNGKSATGTVASTTSGSSSGSNSSGAAATAAPTPAPGGPAEADPPIVTVPVPASASDA